MKIGMLKEKGRKRSAVNIYDDSDDGMFSMKCPVPGADPAQNLTYAQDRVGGGLGARPADKFLGTTPFLSSETPIVP